MVRKFENLKVWQRGMDLVEKIFEISGGFPKSEIYGLTNQIRRAVIGIPSNIAEGCGKKTDKDFVRYLYNALGSSKEVKCHLMIADRLKFIDVEIVKKLIGDVDEMCAMLLGLIKKIEEEE